MSDTPRTDAAIYDTYDDCERGGGEAVSTDFARQLERELTKAQATIERMRPVVERLKYAVSYLEEAATDADVQMGVKHAAGLLEDIRETLNDYEAGEKP